MEAYDPSNPSVQGSFYFCVLAPAVAYNISNYLKYGDLSLAMDEQLIGSISLVCRRLFCQSKINHGLIKVLTKNNEIIGHLVLLNSFAHHFIPFVGNRFAIDKQILYKREAKIVITNSNF